MADDARLVAYCVCGPSLQLLPCAAAKSPIWSIRVPVALRKYIMLVIQTPSKPLSVFLHCDLSRALWATQAWYRHSRARSLSEMYELTRALA